MPGPNFVLSFIKTAANVPIKIENTGLPTTGNSCPKYHAGAAISRHSKMPRQVVLNHFIKKSHPSAHHHTTDIDKLKMIYYDRTIRKIYK